MSSVIVGVLAVPGGMMGYGGVVATKRNDHSSDYAFDFGQSIQHPDISDYTHYEDGEDRVQPAVQQHHSHTRLFSSHSTSWLSVSGNYFDLKIKTETFLMQFEN